MKDNTEAMDKAIKEKFDGHEVPVPSHLWDSIESNLPSEPNNTRGGFFFTNPFIISILFISTVLIGTYIYNSTNNKNENSTSVLGQTNTSDNSLNNSAAPYSRTTTDEHSSIKENNQSSGSSSNALSTINSGEADQTPSTSSNTHSEAASNSNLSNNNVKNLTGTKNHTSTSNGIQYISKSTTNTPSTESNYSKQSQNKHRNASNKNSQQNTINTPKSSTASQPDQTDLLNTSSDNLFAKGTNTKNAHSASTNSKTKSNPFESITTTSVTSAAVKNTAVPTKNTSQGSNTSTSKNSERTNPHADSTKQSSSMQGSDSFNQIETNNSNGSIDKNTSTDNIKTNNTAAISATTTNTTTQASNTTALKNSERTTANADSTKQSAPVQGSDSFNQIENNDTNTTSDKNTLTEHTKTNHPTSTSESNQDVPALQIAGTTAIQTSTSDLAKPSETTSVHNQEIQNNEKTESESATENKHIASNANAAQTSTTLLALDSVNNNIPLENYAHTNSSISNDTTLSANNSTKELLLKTDSTEHSDTSFVLKQSELAEVKYSEEAKKNKKSFFLSRCSIDGYATPALGYIYLSPNSNQEGISESTKDRNKNTSTGFGLTTGLRANYALTQKIEIGIGFQYSSLSQQSSLTQQHIDSSYTSYQGHTQIDSTYDAVRDTFIVTTRYVVTDSATTDFISTNVKSYTDKFQNFSIPIHIAYGYSISNKLSLITRTSLLINYQTSSTTYLNGTDSTIIGYHSNKNLSFGGSFSIGCYYLFSKNCSVFAEPIVSYYFSNVFDKQVPFKQKQLMLGLQTGIRLSF